MLLLLFYILQLAEALQRLPKPSKKPPTLPIQHFEKRLERLRGTSSSSSSSTVEPTDDEVTRRLNKLLGKTSLLEAGDDDNDVGSPQGGTGAAGAAAGAGAGRGAGARGQHRGAHGRDYHHDPEVNELVNAAFDEHDAMVTAAFVNKGLTPLDFSHKKSQTNNRSSGIYADVGGYGDDTDVDIDAMMEEEYDSYSHDQDGDDDFLASGGAAAAAAAAATVGVGAMRGGGGANSSQKVEEDDGSSAGQGDLADAKFQTLLAKTLKQETELALSQLPVDIINKSTGKLVMPTANTTAASTSTSSSSSSALAGMERSGDEKGEASVLPPSSSSSTYSSSTSSSSSSSSGTLTNGSAQLSASFPQPDSALSAGNAAPKASTDPRVQRLLDSARRELQITQMQHQPQHQQERYQGLEGDATAAAGSANARNAAYKQQQHQQQQQQGQQRVPPTDLDEDDMNEVQRLVQMAFESAALEGNDNSRDEDDHHGR